MMAGAVRVYSSMTLKNRTWRPPAGPYAGRTGSAPGPCRLISRTPRTSPAPCERCGGVDRVQYFPRATSFKMSMASSFSATILFNRAFSFSRSLTALV